MPLVLKSMKNRPPLHVSINNSVVHDGSYFGVLSNCAICSNLNHGILFVKPYKCFFISEIISPILQQIIKARYTSNTFVKLLGNLHVYEC